MQASQQPRPKKSDSASDDLFQQLQSQAAAMMISQQQPQHQSQQSQRSHTDLPHLQQQQQQPQPQLQSASAVSYDVPELGAMPSTQSAPSLTSSQQQQQQQAQQMEQYLLQMQAAHQAVQQQQQQQKPPAQMRMQQRAPAMYAAPQAPTMMGYESGMVAEAPMMMMPDMSGMQKSIAQSLERVIGDKLDAQLGKITSLLSDMTLRVLASENKLDVLARRLDESNTLNRDLVQRVEGVKTKQEEVSTQLREIRSTVQSIHSVQQQHGQQLQQLQQQPPSMMAPPVSRADAFAQPPPIVDLGSDYTTTYTTPPPQYAPQPTPPVYNTAPVMTAPPPSSLPPPMPKYHPAPPQAPSPYVQQQAQYASMYAQQQQQQPSSHSSEPPRSSERSHTSGNTGGSSGGRQVQFDDNLIMDAVNMGYPRHKVVDALNHLYATGKSCNDINVLLDFLEPSNDKARSGGQQSREGWKFWRG